MKIYKFIIIIIYISLIPVSCSDFLDENPKSFIAPENFFNSDEDARAAILGTYNALVSDGYYGNSLIRLEGATDLFHSRPGVNAIHREISFYEISPAGENVTLLWEGTYQLIKRANTVIHNIKDNENISLEVRNQTVGEALFLRSYTYYMLGLLYGNVPLVLKPFESLDNINSLRNTQGEVFAQAKIDAAEAITLLPLKSEIPEADGGRVSKGAAQVLLAKLHSIDQEWDSALSQVDAVISSGEYSLWSSITDIFKIANENGKESIFEINFSNVISPQIGSGHPALYGAQGVTARTFGTYFPTPELMEKFERLPGVDQRDTLWIWDKNYLLDKPFNRVGGVDQPSMCMKFYDPDFNVGADGLSSFRFNENNFIVFRYADLLLMKAEIENEVGSMTAAEEALNAVRNRAGATPIASPSGLSKEEFREVVYDERAKELFGENHRMFDLRRRGMDYWKAKLEKRTLTYNGELAIPDGIDSKYEFYPIPQNEIDINPNLLPQTNGW